MDKRKKSDEIIFAINKLAFQNNEKEKRATELIIANKELAYAAELTIAKICIIS